jgi:hypothetical protein
VTVVAEAVTAVTVPRRSSASWVSRRRVDQLDADAFAFEVGGAKRVDGGQEAAA